MAVAMMPPMAHVVIPDLLPREVYTVGATPTVGPFPVPWPYFAPQDIRVWVGDQEATLAQTPTGALEFSLLGAPADGGFAGGNITLGAAVADTLVIVQRAVPIERRVDFPYPSVSLQIEALNTELDRHIAIAQQLQRDLLRTVRLRDEDPGAGTTLPPLADRAGRHAAWDMAGNLVPATIVLPGGAVLPPITPFAETLLAAADAPAARAALIIPAPVQLTFRAFGAVGDGVADDTSAVAAALAAASGRTLDGEGGTYRLTAPVLTTSGEMALQNADFDVSALVSGQTGLKWAGTQGAAVAVTGMHSINSYFLQVASTASFAVDQYVWIDNSSTWDAITGSTLGMIARVRTIDSATQMTLYERLPYDFASLGTTTVAPLDMLRRIDIDRVRLFGAGGNVETTTLMCFDRCADVTVSRSRCEDTAWIGVRGTRCADLRVDSSRFARMRGIGLGYGVMLTDGCLRSTVHNCRGHDLRSLADAGSTLGVNRFVTFSNNMVEAGRAFGLEVHPAADQIKIHDNQVTMLAGFAGTVGINSSGGNTSIRNNTVIGASGLGIQHQTRVELREVSSHVSGNRVDTDGTSTSGGIYVANSGGRLMASVRVSDNEINAADSYGVFIHAKEANMRNVTIGNNAILRGTSLVGIRLLAEAGHEIVSGTIANNSILQPAGATGIRVGQNGTGPVSGFAIAPGRIAGGAYGIAFAGVASHCTVDLGSIDVATQKVAVDGGAVDIVVSSEL